MAEKRAKEEYHKFRALQDGQLAQSDKDFMAALEIAQKALSGNRAQDQSKEIER